MNSIANTKKAVSSLLKRTHDAGRELSVGLEDIRQRIDDLKAERLDVEKIAPTLDIALQRADDFAASIAPHGSDDLVGEARRFTAGPTRYRQPDYTDKSVPLQLWLAPLVGEALKDQIRRHYEDNPGITEDDRQARLDKIDQQILDAELAEESIIRAAEAAGFSMQRREDADPLAVLAAEEVLP